MREHADVDERVAVTRDQVDERSVATTVEGDRHASADQAPEHEKKNVEGQ